MCKSQNPSTQGAQVAGEQLPGWRLECSEEFWNLSMNLEEQPAVDVMETAVRIHPVHNGTPAGEPIMVELAKDVTPIDLDKAQCRYSKKHQQLLLRWPAEVPKAAADEAILPEVIEQVHVLQEQEHLEQSAQGAEVAESEQFAPTPEKEHESLMVLPEAASPETKPPEVVVPAIPSANEPVIQEVEPEVSANEWKARGNEATKAGDMEAALRHYSSGLQSSDAVGEVRALLLSNRALCLAKLQRHEESLADSEQCISLKPDFVKGYLRAATALRALSRPVEAISILKRAPNNDEACALAAAIRPEAEAAEAARLESLPPTERALAEAKALLAKGSFEAAAAGFTKILTQEPEEQLALEARRGRADCHHQLSDFGAVVKDTSFVLEREPSDVDALARRMLALEPLEKYRAALEDARSILRLAPGHAAANRMQHRLSKLVRDLDRENSSK